MKQADFYLLQSREPYPFLMRLAAQLFDRKLRLLINLGTPVQYEYCDQLLWTYNDTSFLPHDCIDENPDSPIVLGINVKTANAQDVLINLAPEVPACFSEFSRIAEIVANDEALKTLSRSHYRLYQQHEYSLKMHSA